MNQSINLRSITFLSVALIMLLGYNFLSAQVWTPTPVSPPANNTPAPINVGPTMQAKTGNLAANIFAATTEMRSNRYCDALGGNCVGRIQQRIASTCPAGEAINGIYADGTISCISVSGGDSCTTELTTATRCGDTPACPAGWSSVGGVSVGSKCGGDNSLISISCQRLVCS